MREVLSIYPATEVLDGTRYDRRVLANYYHVAKMHNDAFGKRIYKRHESSKPDKEVVEQEVKLGDVEIYLINMDTNNAQRVVFTAGDILRLADQLKEIAGREVPPIPLEDIDY